MATLKPNKPPKKTRLTSEELDAQCEEKALSTLSAKELKQYRKFTK